MNSKCFKDKIKQNSLKDILKKGSKRILKEIINLFRRYKDYIKDSRKQKKNYNIENSYLNINDLKTSFINEDIKDYLIDKYLNHQFDILGSGWIKVNYNTKAKGLENYIYKNQIFINSFDREGAWLLKIIPKVHIRYSKYLYSLIESDYEFIDWALDFKSGYRFSQKKWYKDQPIGKFKGVDIKITWEIMRMQHLLQLSIFAINNEKYRKTIIKEFKNQILDFLCCNPLKLGAAWSCTMDVAIRISNILLSYDILKQLDYEDNLDDEFNKILSLSVYDHGKFIINNLEWHKNQVNGNHYLSDISGLLFVSAYLNSTSEINSWLAFSIQEIITSFKEQFLNDGSNFEGSTSYHRLSGEVIIYSTALIYGLLKTNKKDSLKNYNYKIIKRLKKLNKQEFNLDSNKFFPNWYLDRLKKIGEFTLAVTKPNKNIVQIGDNDSGRFIKLTPIGEFLTVYEAKKKYFNLKEYEYLKDDELYFDENILNHESLITLVSSLLGDEVMTKDEYSLEKTFINSLSKNIKINNNLNSILNGIHNELKYYVKSEIDFNKEGLEDINLQRLKTYSFNDFGIFIIKSEEFFLSFIAGPIGQNGKGGHSHCDKLSFELFVRGKDLVLDGGTYLYTPLSKRRDEFRSVKAHNIPYIEGEEQFEFIGDFSVKSDLLCEILEFNKTTIKALLKYKNTKIFRAIKIYCNKVVIEDFSNKNININFNKKYSNGYGKLYLS